MEGGSLRGWRFKGSAWARDASSGETYFSSSIRWITWLRRCTARSGLSSGERRDGFWGRPAMSAASASVRSLMDLL